MIERKSILPFADLRSFLSEADELGELTHVNGADRDLDIGILTEIIAEEKGPILLFDNIKGFLPGFRVTSKCYTTKKRVALALNFSVESTPLQMVKEWMLKMRSLKPVPPVEVSSGTVMENKMDGGAVNLDRFPTPIWHPLDGGRYIGTASAVITRDPDEGWVNVGIYRLMVHDSRTTGIYTGSNQHGRLIMQKYWKKGLSCPVAVAISPPPSLFVSSSLALPWRVSELDLAGWINGEPLQVIVGQHTGLPIPASAEIAIEGEIPPPDVESRVEGPFGEIVGYYGSGAHTEAVIRIKALYHRQDPIIQGEPPLRPPVDHMAVPIWRSAGIWDAVERMGISGIEGLYALEQGPSTGLIVVAIRQLYAGHAKRVGHAVAAAISAMRKWVIVVDDDIDPSNINDVIWAMTTRVDPSSSIEIVGGWPSYGPDPMIPPEKKLVADATSSLAIVYACKPFSWMKDFPPASAFSSESKAQARRRWAHLFE